MRQLQTAQILTALTILSVLSALTVGTRFHSTAHAITLHPDANPNDYLMDATEVPAVFALPNLAGERNCSATLIDEKWAVTAAFCVVNLYEANYEQVPYFVDIDGIENSVEQVVLPEQLIEGDIRILRDEDGTLTGLNFELGDGDYEIALIELEYAASHVTPMELYDDKDEADKTVTLFGWEPVALGDEDSPTEGAGEGTGPQLRVASNRITRTEGHYFSVVFDAPGADDALPTEGVGGFDDLGSPAFIETAKGTRLAGVSVIGSVFDGIDEDAVDLSTLPERMNNNIDYGSQHDYMRMSQLKNWIRGVITANSGS